MFQKYNLIETDSEDVTVFKFNQANKLFKTTLSLLTSKNERDVLKHQWELFENMNLHIYENAIRKIGIKLFFMAEIDRLKYPNWLESFT